MKYNMVDYKNVLSRNDLFFAGTGYIIGAGIFVLLGETSKYSGKYTYLSTLLAGYLIYYIAQSYIKINNKYNSNDAEYKVLSDAFGKNIAKTIIIIAVIGIICGVYLVSSSCGSYMTNFINIKKQLITYAVIFLITSINIIGIESVSKLNVITLGIGFIGIFLIIYYGVKSIKNDDKTKLIKYITFDKNIYNDDNNNKITKSDITKKILLGSYIIIFSYFGFELLIKLNKESINPKISIPDAMKKSIIFTTILYTIIAFIYGYHKYHKKIVDTDTPMSSLINVLNNNKILRQLINLSAVMFAFNTSLLSMTSVSRLLDTQISYNTKQTIPTKYILIVAIITIIMNALDISIKKSAIVANGCILTLLVSIVIAQKLNNI
jgi:APA family basic amino acid/polyamine antiporter